VLREESVMPVAPLTIRMHARDNVAIVANDGGLDAGIVLPGGLVLAERVPQGHKVALVDIAADAPVLRYGVPIGQAFKAIAAGSWVHERLLKLPAARSLEGLPMATLQPAPPAPLEGYTFEGYRNADGSVGTRNILAITQTVQCVAGVTAFAVQRIKAELLPRYPQVDDVVALEHGYGCGVAIDAPDAAVPIRTLRNISLNPNFGGEVMVVSLGCEKLQPERLLPPGSFSIVDQRAAAEDRSAALDVVRLQDDAHVGFMAMVDAIVGQAESHLERLNARRRVTVPASELVVGVQCGGSDAFSGVTANPAVGFCTDLLVRAGASVMFSETTEVRDAIDQLTARAAGHDPRDGLVRRLPATRRRRPQRQHHARQQGRRPGQHRRKGDGVDRQVGFAADHRCARSRRKAEEQGPDLRRHPGQRLHLRHAATGCRHEPACLHHRPRHALWPGGGAGDQGRHAQRLGAALARPDGPQRRPHRRWHGQHRRRRMGTVPPAARGGQRPQEDLGRALEAAQRTGAVQPGASDLRLALKKRNSCVAWQFGHDGTDSTPLRATCSAGTASVCAIAKRYATERRAQRKRRPKAAQQDAGWLQLTPRIFIALPSVSTDSWCLPAL
jgi:altronate dehydratase